MKTKVLPEDWRVGQEHHLARIAAFWRHAEVDVTDNAVAVELAEIGSRDAVLQFLFAD